MTQHPSGPAGWPGADLTALLSEWSEWWRPWISGARPPYVGSQPILPGWTFGPNLTINAGNSSAPQTEVEVLRRHSYGRQLGRINDALEAVIGTLDDSAREDPRITDFLTMTEEIEDVKVEATRQRVEQLTSDLATLKATDREEFDRLRVSLLAVLGED